MRVSKRCAPEVLVLGGSQNYNKITPCHRRDLRSRTTSGAATAPARAMRERRGRRRRRLVVEAAWIRRRPRRWRESARGEARRRGGR